MITFAVNRVINSKRYPGVSFVIKTMTESVRNELRSKLLDPIGKLRGIQAELENIELPRDAKGAVDPEGEASPESVAKALHLQDRIQVLKSTEIDPAYVGASFISIAGCERSDGIPIVLTNLATSVPDSLYVEIVETVRNEAELTDEERANLESPTTSAAQVDGQTLDSTAASASETSCTKLETVDATSLN